jgi:hypothetical protein
MSRAALAIATLGLAGLMGCSDDGGSVTWDLSEPTTPADLGSDVDDFAQEGGPGDGDVEIEITFPSGETVSGTYRQAVAYAGPDGTVNQVELSPDLVESVGDIEAAADEFVAEWGMSPAEEARMQAFLGEVASAADEAGQLSGAPLQDRGRSRVGFFDGEERDGIAPAFGVDVGEGSATLIVQLGFEP